tara:strand:- start:5697 stop:7979 length:2283 start_codon:yes stop_codon:yes gene_type:complete
MTDLWKTHSGSSKNRQFRTHILVTDKSNNWKTDTSTENKRLYHYNGNATAVLGIGTNKPNYRLSFGDSAKQSRLSNLNESFFCLNEKQDGTDATGIGFWELYENDAKPYGNRYYTGIRFMINNGSSYGLNDIRSIKMLLRNDGTLILGHSLSGTTSEAFNDASLDVSGNIKTSKFLILSKVTNADQYIPRGALRYTGSELIYRNDAGLDVPLITKFSASIAGNWDVFEYLGAVGGIFQTNKPIALIDSENPNTEAATWTNAFVNNILSVEGVASIGDKAYLTAAAVDAVKRKGYVEQSGYNMGVLSIQHQLGIGTRQPQAALDIVPSTSIGYLKIGNCDVSTNSICIGDFSNVQGRNSVSIGESNLLNSNYGFIFGENNNTFELDSKYNFIFGQNNDISSNFSYIFGNDNDLNSSNFKQHLVFGENNKLYDSSSVFIYGDNNRIGVLSGGASQSANKSRIFGSNNVISNNTTNSTIVGSNNTIQNGTDNLLFGSNNTLTGGNNNLYFGSDISMNNAKFSLGIGKDISMNGCEYSVGLGYRAELTENIIFAVGSKQLYDDPAIPNQNALEINKDGSVSFETITSGNISARYPNVDIDVYTNSNGSITFGNADTSFNFYGGLGPIKTEDITATIDENRNIFTNCSNTITIGSSDATISIPGSFQNLSDIRVKDNVKTIDNALDKITNLRGVEYTRKDTEDKNKKHLGLIAQEVSEILPEVIGKDKNELLTISYVNIIGVLIESIKELKKKVEILEDNISVDV